MFRTNNILLRSFRIALPGEDSVSDESDGNRVRRNKTQENQTVADLATDAGIDLLSNDAFEKDEVGAILFVSRAPDFRSPITAGLLQARWEIDQNCICYDINDGAVSYIKGLHVAASILQGLSKKYALIVIGDTPSKLNSRGVPENIALEDSAAVLLLENVGAGNAKEWRFEYYSEPELGKSYFLGKGGFRYNGSSSVFNSLEPANWEFEFSEPDIKVFVQKSVGMFRSSEELNGRISLHDNLFTLFRSDKEVVQEDRQVTVTYGANDLLLGLLDLQPNNGGLSLELLAFSEGLTAARAEISTSDLDGKIIYSNNLYDPDSLNTEM